MKKKVFYIFLIVLIVTVAMYFLRNLLTTKQNTFTTSSQVSNTDQKQITKVETDTNNAISKNNKLQSKIETKQQISIEQALKTFSNKKMGISFLYPSSWLQKGEETEIINLSGKVTAISLNFYDTITKSSLIITYYFPPQGFTLYKYALAQLDSSSISQTKNKKIINISGNKAVQTISKITCDGKGKLLNTALLICTINFLDKNKTGDIELQFKTPLNSSDTEIFKFNKLLSTINFIAND